MRTALVIGAHGALGKAVVDIFGQSGRWSVLGVDVLPAADRVDNSTVQFFQFSKPGQSITEMQAELLSIVGTSSNLSAVINAAGGWAGGDVRDASTAAAAELMLRQSLFSSFAAAHVFATHGSPGALLALTGAAAATNPTPGMLGYGTAKAAVHFLCQSVAADASLLPKDAKVLAVLPVTIDTPGNRAAMPAADTSSWTPTEVIAKRMLAWSDDITSAPASGSLVAVRTEQKQTKFEVIS